MYSNLSNRRSIFGTRKKFTNRGWNHQSFGGNSTPKNRRLLQLQGAILSTPQVVWRFTRYLGRLLPQTPSRILGILAHLKMGMKPKYYAFLRWLNPNHHLRIWWLMQRNKIQQSNVEFATFDAHVGGVLKLLDFFPLFAGFSKHLQTSRITWKKLVLATTEETINEQQNYSRWQKKKQRNNLEISSWHQHGPRVGHRKLI